MFGPPGNDWKRPLLILVIKPKLVPFKRNTSENKILFYQVCFVGHVCMSIVCWVFLFTLDKSQYLYLSASYAKTISPLPIIGHTSMGPHCCSQRPGLEFPVTTNTLPTPNWKPFVMAWPV